MPRRARKDGEYEDFYASFYGLEKGANRPARHLAAPARRGAAFIGGLPKLARRSLLVLALAFVAVGLLLVGVSVSATKLGGGSKAVGAAPTDATSQVPGVFAGGVPLPIPTGTTLPAASSAPVGQPSDTPRVGGGRVDGPLVLDQPAAGTPAPNGSVPGTTPAAGSTPAAPPPTSTPTTVRTTTVPTTFTPPPPPTTTFRPPTTTRTFTTPPPPPPSPTKICLVPDLLHPGRCLVYGP